MSDVAIRAHDLVQVRDMLLNMEILNKETRKAIGSLLRVAPEGCDTPICTILASTWMRIKIFFRRPHSDRNSSAYSYSTEEIFVTSEIVRAVEGYEVGRPRAVLYVGGRGEDPPPRELLRQFRRELGEARAQLRGAAMRAQRRRRPAREEPLPDEGEGDERDAAPEEEHPQPQQALEGVDLERAGHQDPPAEDMFQPAHDANANPLQIPRPKKKARNEV